MNEKTKITVVGLGYVVGEELVDKSAGYLRAFAGLGKNNRVTDPRFDMGFSSKSFLAAC
jgi:hypothetical protein